MNKDKTIFVCSECGEEFARWSGKCLSCGQWNTLKEFKVKSEKSKVRNKNNKISEVVDLSKIESKDFKRISTGIGEFDRVLGNGIVPGSVILLGGEPGIGKSTLLLQVASNLSTVGVPNSDGGILYVSGEESAQQIKMRLDRLPNKTCNLQFLAETDTDEIVRIVSKSKSEEKSLTRPQRLAGKAGAAQARSASSYSILIIDSIQTMYDSNFPSTPGSIVQVRECALRFQQLAKEENITIILVGHVTKDGNVAGPRMLEHLVDAVLYLEGERFHSHRILRGVKNRFGATDEIGIFEMTQSGFKEVINPSKLFLDERLTGKSGSVITVVMEGSRPLLVEIQALVSKSYFGYPKRTSSGFDLNRLNLLIAVISKKLKLPLDSYDIYVNVIGGYKIKDPAVDLAICAAIISSYKDKAIDSKICLFGEVGLLGEIRKTQMENKRLKEAERLGFKTISQIKTIEGLANEIFN